MNIRINKTGKFVCCLRRKNNTGIIPLRLEYRVSSEDGSLPEWRTFDGEDLDYNEDLLRSGSIDRRVIEFRLVPKDVKQESGNTDKLASVNYSSK